MRCDGESPCNYCSTRNLNCTRSVNPRKRPRKQSSATVGEEKTPTPCPSPDPQQPQTAVESQGTPTLPTPFSGLYTEACGPEPTTAPEMGLPGADHLPLGPDYSTMFPIDPSYSDTSFLPLQEWGFQYNIADWMSWEPDDTLPAVNPQVASFPLQGNINQLATNTVHQPAAFNPAAPAEFRPSTQHSHWPTYYQNRANEVLASHTACSVDPAAGTAPSESDARVDLLGERKTSVPFPEFTTLDLEIIDAENFGHTPPLAASTYNMVLKSVKEICVLQRISDAIKVSLFPPQSVFHAFMQLYFEYFEKLFPIIHQPTFNPAKCHWVELLALVTIGCRYSKSRTARECVQPMSEILRLSVFHTVCPLALGATVLLILMINRLSLTSWVFEVSGSHGLWC